MNKKQYAVAQAVAAANTAVAKAIVAQFDAAYTELDTSAPAFTIVRDAWNAAHDMVSAFEAAEWQVTEDFNFSRIPASEMGTYALVMQNID